MITFGNTSIDISLIAFFFALFILKLLPLVIGIWFVVQGFRVHWGWGVANLLIPGAFILFSIFHPKESKRPLILLGVYLGILLALWVYAKRSPSVELSPNLPASAKNAHLYLDLVSSNGFARSSGGLDLTTPVIGGDNSHGFKIAERLMSIRSDGFMIQFIARDGGVNRTNFVFFPYDQTIETNLAGWNITGNYNSNMMSWPDTAPGSATL